MCEEVQQGRRMIVAISHLYSFLIFGITFFIFFILKYKLILESATSFHFILEVDYLGLVERQEILHRQRESLQYLSNRLAILTLRILGIRHARYEFI